MKKTRLLIIEDDHFLAQLAYQIIAQSFDNITVTGITGSIREAEKKIASGHPDILLLDVELNDGTAFELLSRIDCKNMKIIFMSAHEEYALEAIAFSSIDFITKPFDINDLIGAIMKAQEEMNDHDTPKQIETLINNLSPHNDIRLYLKSGQKPFSVAIDELIWAQSVPGGSIFKINQQCYFIDMPLRRYELLLAPYAFLRCHSHYLINTNRIVGIEKDQERLLMDNHDYIPLELRRLCRLKNQINPTGLKTERMIKQPAFETHIFS